MSREEQLAQQNRGLGALLQLEREIRKAESLEALFFIAVNDSHRLIPFRQGALFLAKGRKKTSLRTISGVARVDPNAPYALWLSQLGRHLHAEAQGPLTLDDGADLPNALGAEWNKWTGGHGAYLPLTDSRGGRLGGLWLDRESAIRPEEIAILELLTESLGHAWEMKNLQGRGRIRRFFKALFSGWMRLLFAGLAVAALFLPVRQSVLAPAEVAPVDPLVVAAPLDGVVRTFHVKPNAAVKKGDPLFSLDDAAIRNRRDVAQRALAVTRAELMKTRQKAFSDRDSKAELALLSAQVEKKVAEAAYAAELLDRVEVRADRDGIAVFTDANDWLGRPVSVGERVLLLADPAKVELEIQVPVSDAINLDAGAETLFFLNIDPTNPLKAVLKRAAYEAQESAEGILAYEAKATFGPGAAAKNARIGLKGTAKIYGREVSLFYYLFRRPLATVRQFFGL